MDKIRKKQELMDLIFEYGSLKFQKGMSVYQNDAVFKSLGEKIHEAISNIIDFVEKEF